MQHILNFSEDDIFYSSSSENESDVEETEDSKNKSILTPDKKKTKPRAKSALLNLNVPKCVTRLNFDKNSPLKSQKKTPPPP